MAFERLHTDGFCVLQSVVDAADVALHVAQIEAELNLSRKGGNGSTEKDRTLDAISIGARASWPTRGGTTGGGRGSKSCCHTGFDR